MSGTMRLSFLPRRTRAYLSASSHASRTSLTAVPLDLARAVKSRLHVQLRKFSPHVQMGEFSPKPVKFGVFQGTERFVMRVPVMFVWHAPKRTVSLPVMVERDAMKWAVIRLDIPRPRRLNHVEFDEDLTFLVCLSQGGVPDHVPDFRGQLGKVMECGHFCWRGHGVGC
ncbi:hypothetical protein GE09DRAFT_361079 [Coniochaeta sp. 2T2.1]|nr:hypothetical protein GE09DRAFT_361079 [Coniochaeta sp. 2T2.1]